MSTEFKKHTPHLICKIDDSVSHTGRRRVPRRAIQSNVGLLISGKYYIAKAYEVGEGGMLIDSPVPLVKGQRTVVSFRIQGVVQSIVLSKVVYVLEPKTNGEVPKYGILFGELEFDVRRKIRNFVASGLKNQMALAAK